MIASYFNKLSKIGIESNQTTYEKKIRTFFNQISIVGGLFMLMQAITFSFWIHPEIGLIQIVGPIGCAFGLYLHHKNHFSAARIISFSLVMIGGGVSSAFIGKEYAFHLASLTVIVATVICFSSKEFLLSLIPLFVGFVGITLTETNIIQRGYTNLPPPHEFRAMTIVGTLIFVLYELYFITGMSESSENVVDTKLRKINKTVQIQNEELTLMMREIHHRVKNNLQIIISLLRLRSHDLDDQKSKELFDTTIDRIQSMSILHQKIYQSKNIARFNVQEYLQTLTDSLMQSYGSDKSIEVIIESDIEEIPNDFIVSFALILNELVTNSLKHAFSESKPAKIIIRAMQKDEGFSLHYSDNGVWKKAKNENSFGLELIKLLTEQISGEFDLQKTESGTSYDFSF